MAKRGIGIKILGIGLFLAAIIAIKATGLDQALSLESMKASQGKLIEFYHQKPILSVGSYFAVYVLVTALSLPGAAVLSLVGAAIFGFWVGLIVVSFASTIGATAAFTFARFLFRDWVQSRFGEKLGPINEGVQREGAFYLFGLRLIPVFPFFMVNLVMALTPIRTATFYWVSQLGMLPGTAAFVNAGTQIGKIESLRGILSPALIASFAILGVLPWAAKRLMEGMKRWKARSLSV